MTYCFAYNKDGRRCEKAAGHDGDHLIQTVWGDDECLDVAALLAQPKEVLVTVTNTQPAPVEDDGEKPTDKCEACRHPRSTHDDESCSAYDTEMEERCACFGFI